jgi:ubiquinol-cytochrome c reductase cytochrome b subunit
MWPAYALRSVGLLFAVGAAMLLLGGLVQINPVWQWGPFEPYLGTNGAQPDWYMGWLIGALRLMPSFEPHPFNITIAGNPFFGGVVFPGFIFLVLYLWPSLERRITKDRRRHDLLDRPRDRPWRTALGAAFFSWVFTIFVAGASDRILVSVGIPYEAQVRFFRVAAFLIPIIVFFVARAICRELQRTELHPLRGFVGTRVTQRPTGGFDTEQSQSERSSR